MPDTATTHTATPDDVALVALVCNQQQHAAFAVLYERHLNKVFRFVWVRVGNTHDAEDLTAQTFMHALQHIGTFNGRGAFAAWLLGIARHKVADHFRAWHETDSLESAIEKPHPAPAPDETVMQNLSMQRVMQAMKDLAPERAEALSLRIFGELSMSEVAQAMGKSEAAAKMLVSRALADLRAVLRKDEE